MNTEPLTQIIVHHENAEPYPDRIEISGSTKRAGFSVRVNADKPNESLKRIQNMIELSKQATKLYSGGAE